LLEGKDYSSWLASPAVMIVQELAQGRTGPLAVVVQSFFDVQG
jgi:hypothetical protein